MWAPLQVVGRYEELDIDNPSDAFPVFANPATSASAAQAWSAGLNWYLNKNIRLNAELLAHDVHGHATAARRTTAPAIVTRQPENTFFTRLQLAF